MINPTLERIARKYDPKIQKALLQAFAQIKDLNTQKKVAETLVSGGIEAVMQLIAPETPIIIGKQIRDELDDAIIESGRASIAVLPKGAVLEEGFRFASTNPRTAAFINQYELNLISEVSNETLAAVRQGLADDIITGRNPIDTAREFRKNIGLTQSQERAVRNYRKYLETGDNQALHRKLRDRRFDRTIRSAQANDRPLSKRQIDKFTDRYRQKTIKYRAEVIGRTESLRATSIGNQEAIDQMVAEGAVDPDTRKFWSPSRDERVRAWHLRIPELNPDGVPLTGTFVTPLGPMRYPRDPAGSAKNTIQCRCGVLYRVVKT